MALKGTSLPLPPVLMTIIKNLWLNTVNKLLTAKQSATTECKTFFQLHTTTRHWQSLLYEQVINDRYINTLFQ